MLTLLIQACMRSTFSIRSLSVLIIVILNSLISPTSVSYLSVVLMICHFLFVCLFFAFWYVSECFVESQICCVSISSEVIKPFCINLASSRPVFNVFIVE